MAAGPDLSIESVNKLLGLANELVSQAKALQDVRQSSSAWFVDFDTWSCLSSPAILTVTASDFLAAVEARFGSFERATGEAGGDEAATRQYNEVLRTARGLAESARAYGELFQSDFDYLVQHPSGPINEQLGFQLNSLFFSVKSNINAFVSLLEELPRTLTTKPSSSSSSFSAAAAASSSAPPPLPARQPTVRLNLLKELLATEETYSRSLRLFAKYYLQPLKETIVSPQPLIDRKTLKSFSDASEMVSVITQVLLSELNAEFERNPSDAHVGGVFRKLLPLFRLYSQYITRFAELQALLQALKETPAVKAWLEAREAELSERENLPTLTIDSCLIMPVQRIFRYEMLFANLVKETSAMHPDYLALSEVSENLRFINNAINEETRSLESIEYINRLQKEVANLPPIFKSSMIFLRSTTMEARFHRDTFAKTLDLIMFNSVLILSSRSGRQQLFVDSLAFDSVELKELDEPPMAFELINLDTRKKWRFWTQNQEQYASWVGYLGQAVQTNSFRLRFAQLQAAPPTQIERITAADGRRRLLITSFRERGTSAHWTKMWDDRETGMAASVSVYRPLPPPGFYIVGDYCESFQELTPLPRAPENVWAVREDPSRAVPLQPLLVPPADFQLVWTDKGTGSDFGDLSVWLPIAPPGYVALGAVASIHYSPYRPPDAEAMRYRCVHESVLQRSAFHTRPLIGAGGRRQKQPGPIWAYNPPLLRKLKTAPVSFWTVSASNDTERSLPPGTFFPSKDKDAPDATIKPYTFRPFELSAVAQSSRS